MESIEYPPFLVHGIDISLILKHFQDLCSFFFEFFRPGHQEGVVPSRIKELARLKIAALNGCDT